MYKCNKYNMDNLIYSNTKEKSTNNRRKCVIKLSDIKAIKPDGIYM